MSRNERTKYYTSFYALKQVYNEEPSQKHIISAHICAYLQWSVSQQQNQGNDSLTVIENYSDIIESENEKILNR